MAEHHIITGPARGAPRAADCPGACVRVPLDAPPSPRWSRVLSARLVAGLTGHPAVGHLRLDGIVQGADIVLEGVEEREAPLLGPVLADAVDEANRASEHDGDVARPLNMDWPKAEEVARAVTAGVQR
jgi:hypothetical protein